MDAFAVANQKEAAHKEYVASFKPIRAEMIKSLENAVKYNEEDAKAFYEESIQNSRTANVITIIVTLVAILLCSVFGYGISEMITRPIRKDSEAHGEGAGRRLNRSGRLRFQG